MARRKRSTGTFGGSTTRWTAQRRPLDRIDFQSGRPSVTAAGGSTTKHLRAWYLRAQVVCGLNLDHERAWVPEAATLPFANRELETVLFRFGRPRDFGRQYQQAFERAVNVDVLLNATAVEIHPASDMRPVQAMRATTLGGRTFQVQARAYVLACGGIENARLLLAWRVSASDPRGLARLRTAIEAAIGRRDLGVLVEDPEIDQAGWPSSMETGKHHMGRRRMHTLALLMEGATPPGGFVAQFAASYASHSAKTFV